MPPQPFDLELALNIIQVLLALILGTIIGGILFRRR